MADNRYATPGSDVVDHRVDVTPTSLWTVRGRLSVLSYWGQSLLYAIVTSIIFYGAVYGIAILTGVAVSPEHLANGEVVTQFPPLGLAAIGILYFLMIWVGVCMAAKRLHDRNMSAWWLLLALTVIGMIPLIIIFLIPSKGQPSWCP